MKPILFLLILIINILLSNAQSITGSVHIAKDDSTYAIYIQDSNVQVIKEYFFLKTSHYNIKLKENYVNFSIVFKKMGFKDLVHKVSGISNDSIINLGEQYFIIDSSNFLEKVTITGNKRIIKERNDTIFYNISHFKNGTEDDVEDLLKKLPGITVETGGNIKYNGTPIKHVLVNGKNIFNDQYTLGTRNIKADAIEEVQVLTNYNIEELAKGFRKDGAAINLKFKDSYLRTSGNIEVSAGLNTQKKLNTENKITILGLHKKSSFQEVIQFNNTQGYNDDKEIYHNYTRALNRNLYSPLNQINQLSSKLPTLNATNLNHQFNGKFDVGEKSEITIINSLGKSELSEYRLINDIYFLDNDTINFQDINNINNNINRYNIYIDYKTKINESNVVKFIFQKNKNNNDFLNHLTSNKSLQSTNISKQVFKTDHLSIEYTNKKNQSLFTNQINFYRFEEDDRMFFSHFLQANDTLQNIFYNLKQKPVFFSNFSNYFFKKNRWRFNISNKADYLSEETNVRSNIHNVPFTNIFSNFKNTIQVSLERKIQKILYLSSYSYSYNYYTIREPNNHTKNIKNFHGYSTNQEFYISQKNTTTSLLYSIIRDNKIEDSHFPFEIIRSNRSLFTPGLFNDAVTSQKVTFTNNIRTKNLLFNFNTSINYTISNKGIAPNNVISSNSLNLYNELIDRSFDNLFIHFYLSKFIQPIKTVIKTKISYFNINNYFIYNSNLVKNNFKSRQLGLYINATILKQSSISINSEYNLSRQKNEINQVNDLHTLNTNFEFHFANIKNFVSSFYLNIIDPDLQNDHLSSFSSGNWEARYHFNQSRLKLGFKVYNIFNNIKTERIYLNQLSTVTYVNRLLPRSVLLKISYSF